MFGVIGIFLTISICFCCQITNCIARDTGVLFSHEDLNQKFANCPLLHVSNQSTRTLKVCPESISSSTLNLLTSEFFFFCLLFLLCFCFAHSFVLLFQKCLCVKGLRTHLASLLFFFIFLWVKFLVRHSWFCGSFLRYLQL